jgi:cell division protein FtsI (penicillin-binding protein 3)
MTPAHRPGNPKIRWIRFRLLLVAVSLFAGFLLLVARSAQLQILQQKSWAALAGREVKRDLQFEPQRGDIYDRNGHELAVSIQMDSLAADPQTIKNPRGTARKLAAITGIPRSILLEKVRQPRTRFVWLKHHLPPREADAVRALALEGIYFVRENRRYYPDGELAGHILGFVGRDHHGLEGLEFSEDSLLCGQPDTQAGAKDARGKIIYTHGLPEDRIFQGDSLYLTLDKRIQYIAEQELDKTVTTYGAKSGTAVVMEPSTGEILAMAVYPRFNPNVFTSYQPADWRDRAVTDAFEPGSTFKVFLAAAALEEGVVQPKDLFYCEQGNYQIQDHTIHDVGKFGWLSLAQIIRFSSNIGAAKVGEKLGAARFYHYIQAFGFGEPTGIAAPGEACGLIRPPEEWSAVDLAAASFGQSLSVTTLQLASALSAVANNGVLMQPILIKEVARADGQVVKINTPRPLRRVISAATARRLKRLLSDVLTPGGTGDRAALADYTAAGKTGTAQKSSRQGRGYSDDRYTASFIGFVPVADPRIVVVVVINEPSKGLYGGVVAAPAFRSIAEQTLHCLNVTPDKGELLAQSDPREPRSEQPLSLQAVAYVQPGSESPGLMPDLTGLSLRAALNQLRDLHCPVSIHGSGRVVGQSPEPGSDLTGIKSCSLVLAAD